MIRAPPRSILRRAPTIEPIDGIVVVSSADRPTRFGRCDLHGGDELVRRDVRPEVDHLDVRAPPHHRHEVLADVVQVATDRADDGASFGLDPGLDQDRLEEGHRLAHRPGRHEHLGHEDQVRLEVLPDRVHGVGHRVQDRLRRDGLRNGRRSQRDGSVPIAGLDGLAEARQVSQVTRSRFAA